MSLPALLCGLFNMATNFTGYTDFGANADAEMERLFFMTDALTIRIGLEISALRKSAAILKNMHSRARQPIT
jgi:hypothetical protein